MVRNVFLIVFTACLFSCPGMAQVGIPAADEATSEIAAADEDDEQVDVAADVQVAPVNSDERIQNRLQEIMEATGWFLAPRVTVDRGVVFLEGIADDEKHQQWAGATAMKTSDVVAVVNRIDVTDPPFWNVTPAIESLKQLVRETTAVLPLLVVAAIVIVLSYFLAAAAARLTRWTTENRIENKLLRQVAGNFVGVILFIIGVYIALRVSGLTRLAVTLLGGTGLVGLALGFAFRDIAENYLASILMSLNRPFRVGDLIEVEGAKGFVRTVTTRGTVLNTLEGNQIQMPNSTVYKGKIVNYTATPLSRLDFAVGIGFDDSIIEAQQIIMTVLGEHPAVVTDPPPIVIVDSLGSATVNLNVLYWFDQTKHSPLKVGSSVIRQVKQQLTDAKITMPDEARELVFPKGVPVQMIDPSHQSVTPDEPSPEPSTPQPTSTNGEGGLKTEQSEIMRATDNDETVNDKANLIA